MKELAFRRELSEKGFHFICKHWYLWRSVEYMIQSEKCAFVVLKKTIIGVEFEAIFGVERNRTDVSILLQLVGEA